MAKDNPIIKNSLEYTREESTELKDNAIQIKKLRGKGEIVNQHVGDNFYGQTLEEKYDNLREKYFNLREENIILKEKIIEFQDIYNFNEYVCFTGSMDHWLKFLKILNEKGITFRKSNQGITTASYTKIVVHKDDVTDFLNVYEQLKNNSFFS